MPDLIRAPWTCRTPSHQARGGTAGASPSSGEVTAPARAESRSFGGGQRSRPPADSTSIITATSKRAVCNSENVGANGLSEASLC